MAKPNLKDILINLPIPTPDEMRKTSLAWFERVGPTLIDRWPSELAALSMATEFVKFPVELMEPLFDPKNGELSRDVRDFAMELDARIGWKRRFVRLNSRSPKDATWPYEVAATISGKEAISMFACSMRILDDLCCFQHIPEHPAYVCIRDWVHTFRTENEYRCFVKDGKLIGVTHYDYTKPWTGPADGGKEIRSRIETWFAEKVKPAIPVETVVFDLHLDRNGFLLIEINPWGSSDPCWFKTYENVENAKGYIEYAPLNPGDPQ